MSTVSSAPESDRMERVRKLERTQISYRERIAVLRTQREAIMKLVAVSEDPTSVSKSPLSVMAAELRSQIHDAETMLIMTESELAQALIHEKEPVSSDIVSSISTGVQEIRGLLPALAISNSVRAEIEADIVQLIAETDRPAPRRKFARLFLESLRDNLAKAAGAATAGGLIAGVGAIVAKLLGLL